MLLKFEYTAPLVNPAVAAISSRDDPWKPSRANTMAAASSRCWRVMARRRSGVRGSKVVTGPPALLTYPHRSRILLGMQATRQDRTDSRVAAGECAEAQGKDFGLVATERGYNLYVCGNGGIKPEGLLMAIF